MKIKWSSEARRVIREGQSLLINLIDAALVSLAAQDWIAHSARPRTISSRMNLN